MNNFFSTVFDSLSVLLMSEPVFYIVSIIGVSVIAYVIYILISDR